MQLTQIVPVTILDNFLDNPDKIRNWALSLEYFTDPEGRWPGLRTKQLAEINEPFFHLICKKYFSQFYDLKKEQIKWVVSMQFQIVDEKYHSGWIHSDEGTAQVTGIIYLTPNSNLNGGTSIYQEKKNIITSVHNYTQIKEDSHLNKITIEEVKKYKDEHNSQYEETIRVSNIYNRLISFDSHLHHAAQAFFGKDTESRLTLVFFVNELFVNNSPIGRVRRQTKG